ncbi:hypothetical protein F5884DRAFT_824453 [Xylogone sp. PMI_703]|nr:hypothetical protein F5884DRAFT_824453 [Xylogone sp. PMI_703]
MAPSVIIRVGIIGCGEISQVSHIPALGYMSDLFKITYLCDISKQALEYCKNKVIGGIPPTTTNPEELSGSSEVDVVFVLSASEFHTIHVLTALKHDKYVFVEKPMCFTYRDADLIISAEQQSKGKVMVGYMRRYATAFIDAVKEIGGLDKILYARVRDIIGPNSRYVSQSGTFPKKFTDFTTQNIEEQKAAKEDIYRQAFVQEYGGISDTPQTRKMFDILAGLGSHDLSAMREALGMPTSVLGASLGYPMWSALLQYPGFSVIYESGNDDVPRFDAHIEVYSMKKVVRVQYDSPYVKGLPTTMHIQENDNNGYKETMVRKTYEDNYTLEFKELHAWMTEGKEIKTTPQDARKDLDIFKMIMTTGKYNST